MSNNEGKKYSYLYLVSFGFLAGSAVIALAIIFFGISADSLFEFQDSERYGQEAKVFPLPPMNEGDKAETDQGGDPVPEDQVAEIQKVPVRTIPVNSVDPRRQYPLTEWNAIKVFAGFIDAMAVDGDSVAPNDPIKAGPESVITMSGWAGHPGFGMRFENVLVTVCGQVVAIADVAQARPDVVQNVHMNLDPAGWSATVAAVHIPACEDPVLVAWALAPLGYNAFPLHGGRVVQFEESEATGTVRFESGRGLIRREERSAPELKSIRVKASALRVRKCGTSKCEVLGALSGGTYQGFVIEDAGGWNLVQIDNKVGWVAADYIEMLQ